jgi:hypothetical protein
MSWFDLEAAVPLKNLEYWVWAQICLEVGLIAVVGVFLFKIRSLKRTMQGGREDGRLNPETLMSLPAAVDNLEKKTTVLEETVKEAVAKVAALEQQLTFLEPQAQKSGPAVQSWDGGLTLRSQVENLKRQGLSAEEIARRLRLNLAEVKVALDLCRVRPGVSSQ